MSTPTQTDEAVHALRSFVDHLCGTALPAVLQANAAVDPDQARCATGLARAANSLL